MAGNDWVVAVAVGKRNDVEAVGSCSEETVVTGSSSADAVGEIR